MHLDAHDWKYFITEGSTEYRYCATCKILEYKASMTWTKSNYSAIEYKKRHPEWFDERIDAAAKKAGIDLKC
jgi:hypothetical protein